jgi:hypothetical protein
MSNDRTMNKELEVLKKLQTSFETVTIPDSRRDESNAMLANGLYAIDEKHVPPILGFLLMQYLKNRNSLGEDDSFVTVVYFLRGVAEDTVNHLRPATSSQKPVNRTETLDLMSTSQVEAIVDWIDLTLTWQNCRRFRFDLEEAKEGWSRYLVWRKGGQGE